MLSVPIILAGETPVDNPSLNSGPINTQPDPENRYNCWLSVSTHKSPSCDAETSGAETAFFIPAADTQFVPS